jgi:hypothetical protein
MLQKKKILKQAKTMEKTHKLKSNTKCDCGETLKNHPNGGACLKNACTWFHPNIQYIRRKLRKES